MSYLQFGDRPGALLGKAGVPGIPVTYFLASSGAVAFRQIAQ